MPAKRTATKRKSDVIVEDVHNLKKVKGNFEPFQTKGWLKKTRTVWTYLTGFAALFATLIWLLSNSFPQESWQGGGPGSCPGPRGCWTVGYRWGHLSEEETGPCVPTREDCASSGWRHAHSLPQWHRQRKASFHALSELILEAEVHSILLCFCCCCFSGLHIWL